MVLADLRLATNKCTGLSAPMPQVLDGEASPKASWVTAALKEGTTQESNELPPEVLRWLLADPLFVLSFHDPGPRIWRREELNWGPVPKEDGEERDNDDTEPFIHTAVSIDRRLTYGRKARYRLHRFVAKDPNATNEAIKASQRVKQRCDPVLSSNFGGYHSKRDLFRSEDSDSIEEFILAAVKAIERKDRAMWEADGEPPEVECLRVCILAVRMHVCMRCTHEYRMRDDEKSSLATRMHELYVCMYVCICPYACVYAYVHACMYMYFIILARKSHA